MSTFSTAHRQSCPAGFQPIDVSPGPISTPHCTFGGLNASTVAGNVSLLISARDASSMLITTDRQVGDQSLLPSNLHSRPFIGRRSDALTNPEGHAVCNPACLQ